MKNIPCARALWGLPAQMLERRVAERVYKYVWSVAAQRRAYRCAERLVGLEKNGKYFWWGPATSRAASSQSRATEQDRPEKPRSIHVRLSVRSQTHCVFAGLSACRLSWPFTGTSCMLCLFVECVSVHSFV